MKYLKDVIDNIMNQSGCEAHEAKEYVIDYYQSFLQQPELVNALLKDETFIDTIIKVQQELKLDF